MAGRSGAFEGEVGFEEPVVDLLRAGPADLFELFFGFVEDEFFRCDAGFFEGFLQRDAAAAFGESLLGDAGAGGHAAEGAADHGQERDRFFAGEQQAIEFDERRGGVAFEGGFDHDPGGFGPPAADGLFDEGASDGFLSLVIGHWSLGRDGWGGAIDRGRGAPRWVAAKRFVGKEGEFGEFLVEAAELGADDFEEEFAGAGVELYLVLSLGAGFEPTKDCIFVYVAEAVGREIAVDRQAHFGDALVEPRGRRP